MAKNLKEIRTEILINTSPSRIWKILMEFNRYPQWNPFIRLISGEAKIGGKILVRLEPPNSNGMTIRPEILAVNNEKEFRWKGHLLIPGLFDGEHIFELFDNTNGSTTFVQRELFSGILIPLFINLLDNNTRNGFVIMNQQLKVESEKP